MNTSFSGTEARRQQGAQIGFSLLLLAIITYTDIALNFDQPFLSYALACGIIFLIPARVSLPYWLIAIIATAGFAVLHSHFPPDPNSTTDSISLYLGMLGRGCLLGLGWAAIWSEHEERKRLYQIWLLPVAIILFVLLSTVLLNFTVWIQLPVLDSYLYVFDGSLGFQPSFLLAQIFSSHKVIDEIGRQVYRGLPLVTAIVCAAQMKTHSQWRQLALLGTAGLAGYLLYFIFPATGPFYIAGPAFPNFPERFILFPETTSHLIEPILPGPRNAIPSLHMAWAILLYLGGRSFSRLARAGLALFALATAVAALGTGEHYLADLAVAVPFSVAVQAIWSQVSGNTRHFVLIAASGLTFGWFALFRYGTRFFLWSPAFSWGCIVASTAISLFLYRYLDRADLHQGVVQSVNVQQKI